MLLLVWYIRIFQPMPISPRWKFPSLGLAPAVYRVLTENFIPCCLGLLTSPDHPYYHYLTKKVMSEQQTFHTACPTKWRMDGVVFFLKILQILLLISYCSFVHLRQQLTFLSQLFFDAFVVQSINWKYLPEENKFSDLLLMRSMVEWILNLHSV